VVKAQVHAGGRGKAGGIKLVDTPREAEDYARSILGTRLVTRQTGVAGQPVNIMLVEKACDVDTELYLAMVVDRDAGCVVLMVSTEGGMQLEQIACSKPEKICRIKLNPLTGILEHQATQAAGELGLVGAQIKQFEHLLQGMYKLLHERDLRLIEINPLVITAQGDLICLDARINVDIRALYRQSELAAMRDRSQENEPELRGSGSALRYLSPEEGIGCLVNGAGLGMASMDVVNAHGGQLTRVFQLGGDITRDTVVGALTGLSSDPNVKGILVNVLGGIVRCDLIAEGLIEAIGVVGISLPIVVRLHGTMALQARMLLDQGDVRVQSVDDLDDAVLGLIEAMNARLVSN